MYNLVNRKVSFLIFFGLFWTYHSFASTFYKDFLVENWTTKDGLAHNTITDIVQSDDQYMWFSSWEGLTRFNGSNFTNSRNIYGSAFNDNGAWALSKNLNGTVFIGGAQGQLVNRSSIKSWNVLASFNSQINAIVSHPSYYLIVATEDQSLYAVSKEGQITTLLNKDLNLNVRLTSLAVQGDNIFIGTSNGLKLFSNGKVSEIAQSTGLKINNVEVKGQSVFLATDKGVVAFVNGVNSEKSWLLKGIDALQVLWDSKGRLWIGTTKEGLFGFKDFTEFAHINTENGLNNNRVLSIFEDSYESIWIGTNGGLTRLRPTIFNTLTEEQGLSSNFVRAILQTKDESIWIGSSKGVDQYSKKTAEFISTQLESQYVLSLAEGNKNELYAGTYTDGVFVKENQQFIPFISTQKGLPSNEVRAITIAPNDDIWIGTADGLTLVSKNEVTTFNEENGFVSDFITALTLVDDTLWVGTSQGIYTVQNKIVTVPFSESSFIAKHVFDFFIDPTSSFLWIATDSGIYRFNQKNKVLKHLSHVPYKNVSKFFSIKLDKFGYFWMSSNQGIFRIQAELINQYLDGNLENLKYDFFDESNGMLSKQANGRSMPATWLDSNGEFWVATATGATRTKTKDILSYAPQPIKVLFESLEIDQELRPLTENLILEPSVKHFKIRYSGVNLTSSERTNYRVRLSGYNDRWENRETTEFVEFSALPAGTYNLEIASSVEPYDWGPSSVLKITVLPHWWETLYAKILFFGLALCIVWSIVYVRSIQSKRLQRHLETMVEEKTAELRLQSNRLLKANQEKSLLVKDLEQKSLILEKLTREDPLTGLLNRRAFEEKCEEAFNASKRLKSDFCIAFFDIDHFKKINDSWSHNIGDEALKTVALLLKNSVREIDVIARWGGEEFIVLLPQASLDVAVLCCERVRKQIEEFDCSNIATGMRLTISGGIASSSENHSVNEIIHNADLALYKAKQSGRNKIEFSS
jgi:diguanylate cyclase (GGDEF)-like protein